jgi:uncharacterized damage-inducible protein DinB
MFNHFTKIFSLFIAVVLLFAIVSQISATKPNELVIVNEFLGQVDFMQGRVTQLAETIPQDTYTWRPAEGVRSIGEVYLHITFSNYLCVNVSGGSVPEDDGFEMDPGKINEWDTQTTDKGKILSKMEKSFGVLKERIKNLTEDELNKEVEVFGMTMSTRNFIISMIAHCHEHLGQSIAYARSNDVVPPWNSEVSQN